MLELGAIAAAKGDFEVAMTAREKQRFLDCADAGDYYNMLGRVNVERSECSRNEDMEAIHDGIRTDVGFVQLGRMVFGVMEEWMAQELRALVTAKQLEGDDGQLMRWSCVLGNLLSEQGRHKEAVGFVERALEIAQRLVSGGSLRNGALGVYMNSVAVAYSALGRHEDALEMQMRAFVLQQQFLPPYHRDILGSMANLASTYRDLHQYEDALAMNKSVLEFRRRILRPDHPDIGDSMHNVALAYSSLGRHEDALAMRRKELEFRRRHLPPNHPNTLSSMGHLAIIYSCLGRYEDALALEERVLQCKRRVLPPLHPNIAATLLSISNSYEQAGSMTLAVERASEALAIYQAVMPPNHPDLQLAEQTLHRLENEESPQASP